MWNPLKSLFRPAKPAMPGSECRSDADALARQQLQALRESELSVGAHLRQGRPVSRAPGQASGGMHGTQPAASRPVTSLPGQASAGSPGGSGQSVEDFGLSMVMGAATGNALAGYAAGGSIAGGVVGASLSSATTDGTSNAPD
jgi:hypothetical protein